LAEAALYKTNFIKQKWIEDRFMRLDCKQVRIPLNEKQAAMDGLVSNLNLPRILVVEDDPLNQVVFEAALEGAGFQVMLASHADEAAIKLKHFAAEITALIVDIRLPGAATGWDVARAARKVKADMPVIYIDGWIEQHQRAEAVSGAIVLDKPVVLSALIHALRLLLRRC
jgi:CheY-like chemotaxis protein